MVLGRYLARGLAGQRDRESARKWFTRALEGGIADAQVELDALPAAA
jgi:TPR repeat protein